MAFDQEALVNRNCPQPDSQELGCGGQVEGSTSLFIDEHLYYILKIMRHTILLERSAGSDIQEWPEPIKR